MAGLIHASCFSYHGMGCLLLGASGSGKSQLLAQALLHGAELVADDQVQLRHESGRLMASAPTHLQGVVELRGLGLVRLPCLPEAAMHLAVQLGPQEGERLPVPQTLRLQEVDLPRLDLSAAHPGLVEKLLIYLQAMQENRILPQDWHPAAK